MSGYSIRQLARDAGVSFRRARRVMQEATDAGRPILTASDAVAYFANPPAQEERLARLSPDDIRTKIARAKTEERRLSLALDCGHAAYVDDAKVRFEEELGVFRSLILAIPARVAVDPNTAAIETEIRTALAALIADDRSSWPSARALPEFEAVDDDGESEDGEVLPTFQRSDPRYADYITRAQEAELKLADARQNIIPLSEICEAIGAKYRTIRTIESELPAAIELALNTGDDAPTVARKIKTEIDRALAHIVEVDSSGLFNDPLGDRLSESLSAILRPPPAIKVDEWADTYRQLALGTSAMAGPWRTSTREIARGPMLAVTEPGVQTITVMSSTQLLKTEFLQNVIGYFAHLDPCPMLLLQPKDESVSAFSKERLAPMVRATPVLKDLIGDVRTRVSDDTIRLKQFPGGLLAMASAGSPANLAMRAIRVTLLDEVDKYEVSKEGDPVDLAEERTATFNLNRLNVRACSPTDEETSRIYRSYNESDQRRAYLACPECGHDQHLDFFRHVHWDKIENGDHFPETAKLVCEACSHPWTETQRKKILTTKGAIKWKQTRPFYCCGDAQDPNETRSWDWDEENQVGRATCRHCGERTVSNKHAGFHAWKIHSPEIEIIELAAKWITAKQDHDSKKTFVNTQLGLPFRLDAYREISSASLITRGEQYKAEVPAGVVLLTLGGDVQTGSEQREGYIAAEVVGWSAEMESWSIGYELFPGNPNKPEVWNLLREYLQRPFRHESGLDFFVAAACIDSSANTTAVYDFCKQPENITRNVWAIKGASDKTGPWSPIWPAKDKPEIRRRRQKGFRPTIVGVSSAKELVRHYLMTEEPGPGFCHFPEGRPPAYFDQFNAERIVIERRGGRSVKRWKLASGRANEALDCRAYALAALYGLRAGGLDLAQHAATLAGAKARPDGSFVAPESVKLARRTFKSKWMVER